MELHECTMILVSRARVIADVYPGPTEPQFRGVGELNCYQFVRRTNEYQQRDQHHLMASSDCFAFDNAH